MVRSSAAAFWLGSWGFTLRGRRGKEKQVTLVNTEDPEDGTESCFRQATWEEAPDLCRSHQLRAPAEPLPFRLNSAVPRKPNKPEATLPADLWEETAGGLGILLSPKPF